MIRIDVDVYGSWHLLLLVLKNSAGPPFEVASQPLEQFKMRGTGRRHSFGSLFHSILNIAPVLSNIVRACCDCSVQARQARGERLIVLVDLAIVSAGVEWTVNMLGVIISLLVDVSASNMVL